MMLRSRLALSCNIAAFAMLCGCTVGPDYQPPAAAVPASFSRTGAAEPNIEKWWAQFADPVLDRLMARALAGNLDMQRAATRVAQARAQERIAGARYTPDLEAAAQGGYTRLSENSGLSNIAQATTGAPNPALAGRPGTNFATWQAGFDASWELDLFGGTRRAVEAARARREAAEWSLRDAQVTLTAELGRSYFQYRAAEQRIRIADARLGEEKSLLDHIDARVRSGLAASPEARRQERVIAQAAADQESLRAERDAHLHALSILIGEPPTALAQEFARPATTVAKAPSVPPGLPSELLRRRPDLRAAERKLAAATADIGVATADLYPKFSLTGAVNLVSTSLGNFLSADSIQANGAGRISLPVFDGGRRHATVDLRKAEADEASLSYRQQVLTALKDVEDALSRLAASQAREQQMALSEAAARDALDTARVQYRHGLTPVTDVLTAGNTLSAASDASAQAKSATAQDTIALYKALGGGWSGQDDVAGKEK